MAEETEKIVILLQAKDKELARVLDRNNKLIHRMTRDTDRNMAAMDRRVSGTMGSIGGSLSKMTKLFAGTAIVGGVLTLSNHVAGAVSQIASLGDEAKRSGLAVKDFQEWKFVAEQNRIGIDQMVDGFKELNLRADEFIVTGKGPAAEAFSRLGLSPAELREKLQDPSDLMLEIVDRMEDMGKAGQIRVADEVFGGSAGERFVELLQQGDEGLRQTIARAHELGAVLSDEAVEKAAELDRKFGELQVRVGSLGKKLALGMAEGIEQTLTMAKGLDDIVPGEGAADNLLGKTVADNLRESTLLADEHAAAVEHIRYVYETTGASIRAAASEMGALAPDLLEFGADDLAIELADIEAEMGNLILQVHEGKRPANELDAAMQELITRADAALAAAQGINGLDMSGAVAAVDRVSTALQTAVGWARELLATLPGGEVVGDGAAYQSSGRGDGSAEVAQRREELNGPPGQFAPLSGSRPRLPSVDATFGAPIVTGGGTGGGGASAGGGSSLQVSDYQREVDAIREQTEALELEAAGLLAVAASSSKMGDALTYARQRAELMHAAQKSGKTITTELQDEIDALAMSYANAGVAAQDAANDLESMEEQAKRGADAVSDIFLGVLDGSKSAKDAVADLLLEIAKIQITNGLDGLFGSGGGGGSSFFGILGGLLTGKRAGGGAVQAGAAYMVNEHTPNSEVFVPSQSGAILNVPQAQAALRGATGQGEGGTVHVIIEEAPGFVGRVRAEAEGVAVEVVRQSGPELVNQSVAAVSKRMQKSPNYGKPS